MPNSTNPSLAIVFPGQGSQSVGMLADLADQYPVVRDTFAEASEVLDYDLWQLAQSGPEQELNRTDRTQPAMFAAGFAVWQVWQQLGGPAPTVMAGHSLGEYTALAASGAVEFSAAVKLVEERAQLMQQAVPEGVGAMGAILGLDAADVIRICVDVSADQVVSAVNFNSPQQVVVAGHSEGVKRAMEAAKQAGAKRALLLAVSVPSHCSLMKPAADKFSRFLDTVSFQQPGIGVIYNVDVALYGDDASIRQGLAKQLYNPVRWVETIQTMSGQGIRTVLELGPGKVLTGLSKRIDKTIRALPAFDPATLSAALDTVNG